MNKIVVLLLFAAILTSSCTVLNQVYLSDPDPAGKGNVMFYAGGGTGSKPNIDSISENGDIHFTERMELAPNLFLAGQIGVGEKTDLRLSLHLPYLVGGFGLRAGLQQSFFDADSRFNSAAGFDLGFVLAYDSIKVFGLSEELDIESNGALNADLFLPLAYSFSEDFKLILTPRISFNSIFIRYNQYEQESKAYTPTIPSLSAGVKMHKIYIECNLMRINGRYVPNYGISYCTRINKDD